jgi:16S rRNA (uracil1498-N3)-methyltransferase
MRYYIAPSAWSPDEMTLTGEEAHHLLHVLRGKEQEQVLLVDGQGREALTEIITATRKEARLKVVQQRSAPKPAIELTLIQALPREQKMDLIIQKATELGVQHIVPVISDHSVVRLNAGQAEGKIDRWNKIALSAVKQSGCLWTPVIHPVLPLLDYIGNMPRFDCLMTCSLEPDTLPLRDIIQTAKANRAKSVAFLVGPEGDLTVRELAAARNAGARMVSLGPQVLRSETAALYVMSVLQYEFGV